MDPVLPELERMLVMQARRRMRVAPAGGAEAAPPVAPRPARAPRRPAWRSRRVLVLALVLVAIVGTALAVTTPWEPQVGNERVGHPTLSSNAPPAEQLKILAVLRRPQSAADRSPEVAEVLRSVVGPELHGVRTAYVRVLEPEVEWAAVILVSAERKADDELVNPPAREQPLCVLYPLTDRGGKDERGASSSCFTLAEVLAGATGKAATDEGAHLFGLVPDGVETVRLVLSDGTVVTGHVRENFFDVPIPAAADQVETTQWFNKAGSQVGPQRAPLEGTEG